MCLEPTSTFFGDTLYIKSYSFCMVAGGLGKLSQFLFCTLRTAGGQEDGAELINFTKLTAGPGLDCEGSSIFYRPTGMLDFSL